MDKDVKTEQESVYSLSQDDSHTQTPSSKVSLSDLGLPPYITVDGGIQNQQHKLHKTLEQFIEVIVPKIIENIVEVPRVIYREKIVEIPKIEYHDKVVYLPLVHEVEKIIEVPVIHLERKLVEVPGPRFSQVSTDFVKAPNEVPDLHQPGKDKQYTSSKALRPTKEEYEQPHGKNGFTQTSYGDSPRCARSPAPTRAFTHMKGSGDAPYFNATNETPVPLAFCSHNDEDHRRLLCTTPQWETICYRPTPKTRFVGVPVPKFVDRTVYQEIRVPQVKTIEVPEIVIKKVPKPYSVTERRWSKDIKRIEIPVEKIVPVVKKVVKKVERHVEVPIYVSSEPQVQTEDGLVPLSAYRAEDHMPAKPP